MSRNRVSLAVVLALFFIAAAAMLSLATVYTDWLWYEDTGYGGVFLTSILDRLLLGAAGGIFFGGFLLVNLLLAIRASRSLRVVTEGETIVPVAQPSYPLGLLALLTSLVAAWMAGVSLSAQWLSVERFKNAVPFGQADPIFGKDVSFFVFDLPVYAIGYEFAFSLLTLTTLAVLLVYLFSGALVSFANRLSMHPRAKFHLSGLVSLLLLLKAIGYRLDIWALSYSPRGVAFGASYTDIHADLPALNILTAMAVIAAIAVMATARQRSIKPPVIAVAGLIVLSVALRQGYTSLIQQAVVAPDEIAKERPYIEHNIKMTRQAYGLNRVVERDFPAAESLTREALSRNNATVSNIRLWDWRPLKQTYSQLQEIRLYYTFSDVDIDRYSVDGKYQQVTLSVRELNQANLPAQARTWVNQHLKFTHGYGAVVSPANAASPQGLPLFFVQDIPPKAPAWLQINRPEVYFGELTSEYIIVDTKEKEFDYPLGDENAQTVYRGKAGVAIGSLARRVAFALRFRDYEIMLANAITKDSRLLFNRDIKTRVSLIAPFLMYDGDPYAVISNGRVVWMLDAYTVTRAYPYSQPSTRGFNYIRNSVKITVDSYDGTVRYYLFDERDPIARSYAGVFPNLFRPLSEMPEDLRKHMRYPADLFDVQAEMYLSYHMQDPAVFYNKEDQWSMPRQASQAKDAAAQPTESYYMVMQLPGEKQPEYVMLLPFTPANKQNMIAWLAARSDAPNFGEMILYKFPKERLVYGPSQIDARVDQDADISPQLTLWGQSGSAVVRGNMLVIPIEGSIMYVEPLYLQSTQTKLPELKRVIVAYGNRVVMAETLERALGLIFGAEQPVSPPTQQVPPGTTPLADLAARAARLYRDALQKLQAGDFAGYGSVTKELGQVLTELENRSKGK